MTQLDLALDTQHRALADAESLLRIFQAVKGEMLIEKQKTNEFVLLLTNFKQLETTFDLMISTTTCRIINGQITIEDMQTIREQLPFEIHEEERITDEGDTQISQFTTIKSSTAVKDFLQQVIKQIPGRILISRTALRSLSRVLRLHGTTLPKTEVMTLINVLDNEEAVVKFNIGDETTHAYEEKISRLIRKFEGPIIDEFNKRALLPNQVVSVS
jgi:DNA polymerase-3 subunit epsilon